MAPTKSSNDDNDDNSNMKSKEDDQDTSVIDEKKKNDKELYLVHCHCNAIQAKFYCNKYTVNAWDCNCSDCIMRGNVHVIIPQNDFILVKPKTYDELIEKNMVTIYQWGTKTAVRYFCNTCGILPWYRPRSNPDGYAITLKCIDWEYNEDDDEEAEEKDDNGDDKKNDDDDDDDTEATDTKKNTTRKRKKGAVVAVQQHPKLKPKIIIKQFDGRNWEKFYQSSNIRKESET